ncbi:hypothetical protein NG791_18035 [Laspinema sp. D1]|uniref:hypothetical protein n=1 Tax=Laspinema palackyanum TaxID=3231601 RepID=UPI00347A8DC8|nr:hypothetical protein [Laspinema sp. D2b]
MGSARVHVRSNDFSRYPRDWAQPSHALIAHVRSNDFSRYPRDCAVPSHALIAPVRSNDFSRFRVTKAIAFFTPPYQA